VSRPEGIRRLPRTRYTPVGGWPEGGCPTCGAQRGAPRDTCTHVCHWEPDRCAHCRRPHDQHELTARWTGSPESGGRGVVDLWLCPRKVLVSVELAEHELDQLHELAVAARRLRYGALGRKATTLDVVRQVLESLADGARRPGAWEATVVSSVFGVDLVATPTPLRAWRRALPARPRRRPVGLQPTAWFHDTRTYSPAGGRS